MNPKKRNLESLWLLVQRWEGEKLAHENLWAAEPDNGHQMRHAATANTYGKCLQQLARALARLERKGKG